MRLQLITPRGIIDWQPIPCRYVRDEAGAQTRCVKCWNNYTDESDEQDGPAPRCGFEFRLLAHAWFTGSGG